MHKYSRVTYSNRCQISAWLQDDIPVSEIASRLNKHKSTIYREIARNRSVRRYNPETAQKRSRERYRSCRKEYKLKGKVKSRVRKLLKRDWSAEQITVRLRLEGLEGVSHECIYQYIRPRKELYRQHLRRLRRQRGCGRYKQKGTHQHSFKPNIAERPSCAEKRSRLGDIERDIMFAGNKTPILVCVDRKSRYTKIRLVSNLKAETVNNETNRIIASLPFKVRTTTSDRGAEFKVPLSTTKTYYCDPQRPQQRGTVENTIGLIRQYVKRKTDPEEITQRVLNKIEKKLNNRPRKVLDFKTPSEVVTGKTVALAS